MMHGYLQQFGKSFVEIYSAGIEVHGVNSLAIKYMKEDGIDISNHISNHVDEYMSIDFDYIITVCDHAKEHCPYFPSNAKHIHQNFFDPTKFSGSEVEIRNAFLKTRNEIKEFAKCFLNELINP